MIGDRYQSRNGQIGEVKTFGGVEMLEVRNSLGKITQTIVLRKIDLKGFKKVSDD